MAGILEKVMIYYDTARLRIGDLREAMFIWGTLLLIVVFIVIPWVIGFGTYIKLFWRLING